MQGATEIDHLWQYLLTGFVAQFIGSLLGMGYGTVCSGVLLGLGIAPALASASANTASSVTTGFASWFHHKEGNVERKTFLCLAIPGVIGGVAGATMVSVAPPPMIKPFIGIYLLLIAAVVAIKSVKPGKLRQLPASHVIPLGFIGGLLGSLGGGGWGPLVNSHLVANGQSPRHSIGSSNAAKAVSSLAAAATFAVLLKTCNICAVTGLIIGGSLAAPMAAWACKRMPAALLMASMAVLLVVTSAKILGDCCRNGFTQGALDKWPQQRLSRSTLY